MDASPGQRIAAEIRAEMARQGITPSTVTEATDMARSTLHRKLTGRVDFTLGEAIAVSEALGVPLSELTRRAESATQNVA